VATVELAVNVASMERLVEAFEEVESALMTVLV
jgi:hypothetical protein